ncbi:MAG: hypothetical protein C0513_09125, partial [Isosphaera sp.]|nr:hypothetical protein [Isosphaera sp.]
MSVAALLMGAGSSSALSQNQPQVNHAADGHGHAHDDAAPRLARRSLGVQAAELSGPFTLIEALPEYVVQGMADTRPSDYLPFYVDLGALRQQLVAAPAMEAGFEAPAPVVYLPLGDGTAQRFAVRRTSILPPALAAKYPEIETFDAVSLDDPGFTARFEVTPRGVSGSIRGGEFMSFLSPYSVNTPDFAVAYTGQGLPVDHLWRCETNADHADHAPPAEQPQALTANNVGATVRVYSMAVAATGEFTASTGGTVATGLASVASLVNQLDALYRRESSVGLQLVPNNDLIIFTNGATDPYTNGDNTAVLNQNQAVLDGAVGFSNYDIGHALATGGGGVASLSSVCSDFSKGRAMTASQFGPSAPLTFAVFAHEVGHQFGARHSFNSSLGSCTDNRDSTSSVEPGSGTTIMSYAGLCSTDNVANIADLYYHSISLEQIRNHINGTACADSSVPSSNQFPTVTVPPARSIPTGTPFELTGSAVDPEGNPLTYAWEQRFGNPPPNAATLATPDDGRIPLFRSRAPITSPTRTFPRMEVVRLNTFDQSDRLPTVARAQLPLRLTVRDQRPDGTGGWGSGGVVLNVVNTGAPFTVTGPAENQTVSQQTTVTWNVAGTNLSPINAASVRIRLSTDDGLTYPITLIESTPNDGSEVVTVPNISAGSARVRVDPTDNYFFNISRPFRIIPAVDLALAGTQIADDRDNGNSSGFADPGETTIAFYPTVANNGGGIAGGVTVQAVSLTPTATVVTDTATFAPIGAQSSLSATDPVVFSLSEDHPCGAPISFVLSISSPDDSFVTPPIVVQTGAPGPAQAPVVFNYAGSAVAIPDGNLTGVTIPLTIPTGGEILDLDFRFTRAPSATTCSTSTSSTTVGLTHGFVGDLSASLISPAGTSVTLFARPGGSSNSGNNFCNTFFSDEASTSISSISSTGNPWSSSYRPDGLLSAFDGQDAQGTWNLRLTDSVIGSAGTVRYFALSVTLAGERVCTPPLTVGP